MPFEQGQSFVQNGRVDGRWNLNEQFVKNAFYLGQLALGIGVLIWFFLFKDREKPTSFRSREADRGRDQPKPQAPRGFDLKRADPLAQARMEKRPEPLRLTGIRIDARPHELLGVKPNAPVEEIQKSYRDLMKQYHPDRVGRPGSREWQDAQRIAEALNRAKDEMLGKLKKKT